MAMYTQRMVDLSVALENKRAERSRVEEQIAALVIAGKEEGMTWAMIGNALHTSGQAAWERFGLTPEEKAARSRQNSPAPEQDTLLGLEETHADRVAARKVQIDKKRGGRTKK